MPTPRYQLVDTEEPMHYHLISACVRHSYLCGRDRRNRKNYNHRKKWLLARLNLLARCFAVEIEAYALMSNHFHLIVYYDPKASHSWSAEEVARRWFTVFERRKDTSFPPQDNPKWQTLIQDPALLRKARHTLGSLSAFMKHLKQPIAVRANKEDGCRGHFFESRFYSGALLDNASVVAAMAYVDLNPVRAKIAKSLEACKDSSIGERLREMANSAERLKEVVAPLMSGLQERAKSSIEIALEDYLSILNTIVESNSSVPEEKERTWFARVASFKHRQRAHGTTRSLDWWKKRQGWKRSVLPLPL